MKITTTRFISAVAALLTAAGLTTGCAKDVDKKAEFNNPIFFAVDANSLFVDDPSPVEVPPAYVPPAADPRAWETFEKNKDTIGWITIHDTKVDYPVVQSTDNDFYLHKNIDKKYDDKGTLFADFRDIFHTDDKISTDNVVIYGHNMLNGSMFGTLGKYRSGTKENMREYWETHKYIELSLLSGDRTYTYEIFALLPADGTDSKNFPYWQIHDLDTKEEFDKYVGNCKSRQYFDTGVDVAFGDKLLTLQTCISGNTRFLVVAKKLADDFEIPADYYSDGTLAN